MDYTYTTTTTSTDASGAVAGLLVVYVLMLLFVALPAIVVAWKLFQKAGRPGWAAIVPFYNTIVMLQIAKLPMWYFVMLFIPFVNFIFSILILIGLIKQYKASVAFWLTYIFVPIIALFLVNKVEYVGNNGGTVVTEGPVASSEPMAPVMPAGPAPATEAPVENDTPQGPVAQ